MTALLLAHWEKHIEKTRKSQSVIITIICAFASYFLANTFINHILDKIILMNILISALAFSLLAGFYWKRANTKAAISSTIVGTVIGLFCYMHFDAMHYTWYWGYICDPVKFCYGRARNSQ